MADEQNEDTGNHGRLGEHAIEDGSAVDNGRAADDRRTSDGDATHSAGLPGPLLEVVANPSQGRHRLPFLLGLLDGDDPELRLTAGTAVCLVVESHPDLCAYVVGRLVDRLGDDAPVEVAHALDYLAARRPRAVDRAVSDLDDAAKRVARERTYRTGGGFVRNEYLAPTGGDRDTDRVRLAGEATADDPRQVYSNDGEDQTRRNTTGTANSAAAADPGDGETDAEESTGATDDELAAGENSTDAVVAGADAADSVTSGTLTLVSKRLAEIIAASRFDDLTVLTERRRDRYGDVYRTVGTVGGDRHAVALTVYRLPETDREAFATGLQSAFSDWSDVDDHENILTVFDWELRPRPWAALDYTDVTLAKRQDDPRDPLWTAVKLADAVAHAHQHGVVHGALDPGNVAYFDTVLDGNERRQPLLTHPGLAAQTNTAEPGVGVDPRYAAPEHYDDDFGRVDHATDVYGLGVLLYRLACGHHPYDGDADAVRDRVLSDELLELHGTDTDLPAELDQILRKATATQKIRRYESITHLRRELESLRESDDA